MVICIARAPNEKTRAGGSEMKKPARGGLGASVQTQIADALGRPDYATGQKAGQAVKPQPIFVVCLQH
jgi:hypothetical protein